MQFYGRFRKIEQLDVALLCVWGGKRGGWGMGLCVCRCLLWPASRKSYKQANVHFLIKTGILLPLVYVSTCEPWCYWSLTLFWLQTSKLWWLHQCLIATLSLCFVYKGTWTHLSHLLQKSLNKILILKYIFFWDKRCIKLWQNFLLAYFTARKED